MWMERISAAQTVAASKSSESEWLCGEKRSLLLYHLSKKRETGGEHEDTEISLKDGIARATCPNLSRASASLITRRQ